MLPWPAQFETIASRVGVWRSSMRTLKSSGVSAGSLAAAARSRDSSARDSSRSPSDRGARTSPAPCRTSDQRRHHQPRQRRSHRRPVGRGDHFGGATSAGGSAQADHRAERDDSRAPRARSRGGNMSVAATRICCAAFMPMPKISMPTTSATMLCSDHRQCRRRACRPAPARARAGCRACGRRCR